MKNILKNNGLGLLLASFAMIFVGNVFSMRMTPQGREKAKAAAQGIMAEMKKQQSYIIKQKAATLQPKEYFVYAKGTADGVIVTRDVLEKSLVLKGMLEGTTWQQDHATIPLPFSADVIKDVFISLDTSKSLYEFKVFLKQLSLDRLIKLCNAMDYLDIPQFASLYVNELFDRTVTILNEYEKIFDDYANFEKQLSWNSPTWIPRVFPSPQYSDYTILDNLNPGVGGEVMKIILANKEKLPIIDMLYGPVGPYGPFVDGDERTFEGLKSPFGLWSFVNEKIKRFIDHRIHIYDINQRENEGVISKTYRKIFSQ